MAIDHDLSEGKCPFRHTVAGAPGNADWWPNQLNVRILRQNSPQSDPMDKEFNYAEEFKSLDLNAVIKDLHALMTDVAGLVAGRLWPLRWAFHSDGVARRGYVPHRRRSWRRRSRAAAIRAAQQLAGQRQPRQGAAAALADKGKVWPENLLGRLDGSGRQRRARVDGLQDLRLRRRTRGCLGARGAYWGPERKWLETNVTAATVNSQIPWALFKWD